MECCAPGWLKAHLPEAITMPFGRSISICPKTPLLKIQSLCRLLLLPLLLAGRELQEAFNT
eukprot:1150870-Pelagomonas_calceolata.AAC.8